MAWADHGWPPLLSVQVTESSHHAMTHDRTVSMSNPERSLTMSRRRWKFGTATSVFGLQKILA